MDEKTLADLAYYRIRGDISGFCASEEGRAALCALEPFTDSALIERRKACSKEWQALLQSARTSPLTAWAPAADVLRLAAADGAALSLSELYAVYQLCTSAQTVQRAVESSALSLPLENLRAVTAALPTPELSQALHAVTRVIDSHGELRDLASLREIRARIASIQADIARELHRYTSDAALSAVLESKVPAYRADRQVLAVKASEKARVQGIVHEVSQSGQTVYIEPAEVVRKNNELVQEEFRLQAEVRKICAEATAALRPLTDALTGALSTMLFLDVTLAAARWGMANRCTYALPCHAGAADADAGDPPLLLQARHPLLGAGAVPVTIPFMSAKRVLIITGANTGGKTVALKTFALLSLLNQTGFPVPAAEGTRLPVFTGVFADIGDEQSIDQSLSTFSAHMKNIARAVTSADAQSLVLLDELGSGTDPEEGGAIAMSVLDALIEKRAFVLVTTHHGVLKNYGYTNGACANASVEFDETTLSPTYRLAMGVPGESHALDIAARSGLPAAVVAQAQRYVAGEQADVSALIASLIAKHAEADSRLRAQEAAQQALGAKELQLDARALSLREAERTLKEREHRAESDFAAQMRRDLENLVRKLREGEITREKTLAAKQLIASIDRALSDDEAALEAAREAEEAERKALEERLAAARAAKERGVRSENGILLTTESGRRTSGKSKRRRHASAKEAFAAARSTYDDALIAALTPQPQKPADAGTSAPQWVAGAEVFAGKSRSRGTLVRKERAGVWTVQLGAIRMTLKERDLVLAPPSGSAAKASVSVELSADSGGENAVFMKHGATARPVLELRLLGLRAEEAIKLLQRQLDLCAMQGFKTFSVVHGKGNGVLQQAVQDYLSSYPAVQEFHFARPEEGGTGKTYVTLT